MFIILCANGPGSVGWNDLLALLPSKYVDIKLEHDVVDVGNSSVDLNNRISPTLDKSAVKDKMLWSRTVLRYYKIHLHCNSKTTMSNQKYFECTDGLALLLHQDILVC